jgi:ribose 5-phosphate isomerase A
MTQHDPQQDIWKQQVGEAAAKLVEGNMIVGLGTGSTANQFILALGRRVQQGLRIAGAVSSSQASYDLAASVGIPVADLDTYPELDIYIDGADEVDPQLQLIKGAGGALLREKIVASAARSFVVIADTSKLVQQLGLHFPVPVEVVPFAVTPVRKRLEALGAVVTTRQRAGQTFITENQNLILDCTFSNGIADPVTLNAHLHAIVGIVETGLFLQMAKQAVIGGADGVHIIYPA